MKKTLSVSAAALLLAACGGSNLDPNTVRGALPAADSVQIGTPAASSSASAKALVAPGTIAQPSQVPAERPRTRRASPS